MIAEATAILSFVGSSPLFVTGTARSGSTLLARALECSGEVALGIDAMLPAFRSLRTALLRAAQVEIDPETPIEDYYFRDERLRRLDAVQQGDLDIGLPGGEWRELQPQLVRRAHDEAASLVPAIESLRPDSYRALFDEVLAAAGGGDARWTGLKDVWTIEFLGLLARAYPDARFVVIVRDPRAVVASIDALGAKDASQAGHVLSYLRHWRKYHAFLAQYEELRDRIHVVVYEQLVGEPDRVLPELAAFLDLARWEPMLKAGTLEGNSSFAPTRGIDAAPVERWKRVLGPEAVALAHLVCGAEMPVFGYDGEAPEDVDVLGYLRAADRLPVSWRSDLGDPDLDHRLELGRRALLAGDSGDAGTCAIRRAFLFERAHRALREAAVAAA